jgi:adenosylhomocysteine nucleosidase
VASELTCVLFALSREAMYFRATVESAVARALPISRVTLPLRNAPCPAWLGEWNGGQILVVVTGMGAAATKRALDQVLPLAPRRIISAGFCGALVPELAVGALIQPDEIIEPDGSTWPVSGDCARTVGLGGRLVTVSAPVFRPEERQRLRALGAIAVDMESAAAARICHEAGIAFDCLRAVSDDSETPISAALWSALQGERVRLMRLGCAVMCKPSLVLELRRLARQSRIAAKELADGLSRALAASRTG